MAEIGAELIAAKEEIDETPDKTAGQRRLWISIPINAMPNPEVPCNTALTKKMHSVGIKIPS